MRLGAWSVLVGRRNSLTSEFWSLHFLHGLGALLMLGAMLRAALRSPWCSGFRRPRVAREGWVTLAAMKRF